MCAVVLLQLHNCDIVQRQLLLRVERDERGVQRGVLDVCHTRSMHAEQLLLECGVAIMRLHSEQHDV